MPENKANIPHDDFVAKVVKDPKQPPDTILLTGYIGKSSEEGHTRLYFDPELKNYVEIPNDAILHTQQIPPEHSSLGGAHVWIKSDAELIHGKVGPSRTKAKFFEGPIGAAAAAAGAAGAAPQAITQINCPPTHAPLLCPHTALAPCISVPLPQCLPPTPLHPVCPTHVFTQCPTPLHGCPPLTAVTQCPSPLHGCPTPLHPLCPPTPLHPICPPTPLHPACPPTPQHPLCPPTPLHPICPPTPLHPACPPTPLHPLCPPTPPVLCPTPTINVVACGPHLTQQAQCVASPAPACGGFPGGPGGPVEHAALGAQAGLHPTSPAVCQLFTPACPSAHHICPTNPVFCHHSPFCPSPFCPSLHVPCVTTPGCPFPTPGCPFNPGGGGFNQ